MKIRAYRPERLVTIATIATGITPVALHHGRYGRVRPASRQPAVETPC